VVAGSDGDCCGYSALARAALARYAGSIDVQYVLGRSIADTLAAVRALPPDAVVLYLAMFRDGDGQPQVPRDVLMRISAVSQAPVFGVFETYLGHGIVAGSIASYEEQGRRTGALVARVLNGDDPAAIGVQPPAPSRCIADWQQLRRWGIDQDLLPADCEVRFKQPTIWDEHRRQILTVLAVILMQAALIVALMLNRRRLRQAQLVLADECTQRNQAEALAAQLRGRLARFSKERSLGTMAASIAHEVNQPLIAIQNYAQAAKRRLQGKLDDRPKLIELFAKIEGQAERAGAITQRVRSLVSSRDPQLQPVALCPLFEEVIRMMEPEVASRGCRIACNLSGDAPTVLADPLQVQLVLVNLLQNATQSISSGDRYDKQVRLDVRRIDGANVAVSVTDRGPGVPPDWVADIFEPLYSGRSGGMGMGLPIARAIIEAHGGRLWHEPNPAGGAIFRFTLRAVAACA
jgi:signal transduction histidine kinase